MNAPAESSIYDGRWLVGVVKPLSDGTFEAFIARDDDRLEYLAKTATRKEAAALVHAHAAGLKGAAVSLTAEESEL